MADIRIRVRKCPCGCITWPWEVLDDLNRVIGRHRTWVAAMAQATEVTQ